MAKRYYVAYGSNLNVEQMAFRCPNVKPIGTAVLENHTLFFRGSQTGSYLTIEPKIGGKVPVAVWSVMAMDEAALDHYEGFPNFYYKADFTLDVTPLDGGESRSLECFAYIMDDGNVVHYGYIEKFIERLGERFNIREIAFDRWGAVQMVQNLEGMGFTVVPFGQGFKDMSPPTKELMKLVLEERVAHGGHPVLRWMMDNIYIRTDPAGNIKADKEKSTEKIDGAIAMIMGLDRAIRCGNDSGESVYDSRGILFL